jgi:radical SAM superfamily enzyme with C-terminal helix-hairpin-helix motif
VQTPGKYLSARPGTLNEVVKLLAPFKLRKILAGPAVTFGTQFRGGSRAKMPDKGQFDELEPLSFDTYDQLQPYALKGAGIYTQFPRKNNCIVEIETGHGCPRSPGCSFCTEPIKNTLQWRQPKDIIEEVKTLMALGAKAFRLGKQSCIFSYKNGGLDSTKQMLKGLAQLNPCVLHIDNVNPAMVTEERTKLFVEHCTPGSTAAMGVESFDPVVTGQNNLNCPYDMAFEAIRTINYIGGFRGENGCHALLPGVNILLGLKGETPETLDKNFAALKRILGEGLLIRRINIRQVVPFPGTALYQDVGRHFLRQNRRLYNAWIKKVRREIDVPMLRRLFPPGTILRRVCSEVHNSNVTFLRQVGSYPIVVRVLRRLPLGEFFDVRVTGYMLRSLNAELV